MEQTWSTAGHGRGTAYVPAPRGVHPRQSGAPSALTPWVIPRVRPQRVRHWSKKPAALVTLAGAEAPRVSGSSETKTEGVSEVLDLSEGSSKLIPIHEESNHQIVHLFRLGKA